MRGASILGEVIGKTISGVYCRENNGLPTKQIFIAFDDNTHIEIYAGFELSVAQGIDEGGIETICKQSHRDGKVVFIAGE